MRAGLAAALALVLVLALTGAGQATRGAPAQGALVDQRVLEDTAGGRIGHFLVRLRARAELAPLTKNETSRAEQGRLVVDALRGAAADSQAGPAAELRRLGARLRPYWIVNALAVTGDRAAVQAMAARSDVEAVEPDRAFRGVVEEAVTAAPTAPRGVEWNVERVGAPGVWALGQRGEGMVYANADTGAIWDHPALKRQYRGWDGTTAVHDYNWWDAVHGDIDGAGNRCGFSLRIPCDDDLGSHGTHTLGTAVGDDGAGNAIGVAPGARWISCRNMDNGIGRPSTYIECLQFFLAPTDLNGRNPDPARRPHAVGNSYSCPPDETCTVGSLQAAVDAMRAGGVFMAVSAGNTGPRCSTVSDPPALYDSAVTVGSVDLADLLASTSARGPVTADGSLRLKPDLVAPGVDVRSSVREGYAPKRGTSMASPHVGAAALLLWSAFPALRRDVDRTERLLQANAVRLTSAIACGGETPTQTPNNLYGHGRLDVLAAYRTQQGPTTTSRLSTGDVSLVEGSGGARPATFRVVLTPAPATAVVVAYATADGSARAGRDYVRATGTLRFAAGEAAKTLRVAVVGDRLTEPTETFSLVLTAPAGAAAGRLRGTARIRDDDADRMPPRVTGLRVSPAGQARFVLSEAAAVTLTLERVPAGGKPQRVARQTVAGRKGANAVEVLAQLRLRPGLYRVVVVARDAAGNRSQPVSAPLRLGP